MRITGATTGVRGTFARDSCGGFGCTARPSLPITAGTDRRPKLIGNGLGIDPLTRTDLTQAGDDLTAVWRHHYHWMHTGQLPPPRSDAATLAAEKREKEAAGLSEQLYAKHDQAEPARIGAAYRLASIGDNELALRLLADALYDERESVRRAATYGLVAVGPDATGVFLEAATAPLKWVRKAGVFGLGDVSPLNHEVLKAVVTRLEDDPSVYVRSVAAGSLGCLGRRAIAASVGTSLIPACLEALAASLEREANRLCVNRAQNRGHQVCSSDGGVRCV